MLKKPDKLISYVNAIKIPGAKKYAKEITELFNDAQKSV
ncbi:hypothetical protein SDC9_178915 [bioreactor metagenome]|uniref:Uncharacterized protein n=1 Tax=bioreactor metagenome TaxID=1076179 RepID=A0A645GX25_9ZZZZ